MVDEALESPTIERPPSRRRIMVLLISVCLAAACAIVYELIIAAMSTYLLGNSIYYFSITIGLFMSSMGLGSFLSRYVRRNLVDRFIQIELGIGIFGGISTVLLMGMYVATGAGRVYYLTMVGLIVSIGTFVGLEIPVLTRIMKQYGTLRVTIANVLAFDYVGALTGSIAFPLVLLKYLGLVQSAFLIGLLNVLVAVLLLLEYWPQIRWRGTLIVAIGITGGLLGGAVLETERISRALETRLYDAQIVHAEQSEYQRIVLTRAGETWGFPPKPPEEHLVVAKRRNDLRLYIDGQIQFSSVDEYRYHEALVHPAMGLATSRASVLILGGGDGLAAREVLKYPEVRRIVLVDLDPAIIRLCRTHPEIVALNEGSLNHPKVRVINRDAYKFLEATRDRFDVILIDLPDPHHESLAKLYTVEFYRLAARALNPGGTVVTQSTSPYFARAAFWSIHRSMEAAGLHVLAYHVNVPSLGDWGFNLGAKRPMEPSQIRVTADTLYLNPRVVEAMFQFGKDTSEIEVLPNTLLKPILIYYYNDERWAYY